MRYTVEILTDVTRYYCFPRDSVGLIYTDLYRNAYIDTRCYTDFILAVI